MEHQDSKLTPEQEANKIGFKINDKTFYSKYSIIEYSGKIKSFDKIGGRLICYYEDNEFDYLDEVINKVVILCRTNNEYNCLKYL